MTMAQPFCQLPAPITYLCHAKWRLFAVAGEVLYEIFESGAYVVLTVEDIDFDEDEAQR